MRKDRCLTGCSCYLVSPSAATCSFIWLRPEIFHHCTTGAPNSQEGACTRRISLQRSYGGQFLHRCRHDVHDIGKARNSEQPTHSYRQEAQQRRYHTSTSTTPCMLSNHRVGPDASIPCDWRADCSPQLVVRFNRRSTLTRPPYHKFDHTSIAPKQPHVRTDYCLSTLHTSTFAADLAIHQPCACQQKQLRES